MTEKGTRSQPVNLEEYGTTNPPEEMTEPGSGSLQFPGEEDGATNRYAIREEEGERYLLCVESPGLRVQIDWELTFSSTSAKKAAPGTIFLDGVAQSPPFLDMDRQILNLDHHEGCLRSFTLATCEQALLLVLRGLELRERQWTIFGNDPDMDTCLAIWVLLNARNLSGEDPDLISKVIPLVRFEGIIDAQGLERVEFTGFSEYQLAELQNSLERLRGLEVQLKKENRWKAVDPLEYTLEVLHAIDKLVYSSEYLKNVRRVEELARFELGSNRIGLVCRSDQGVYEVESDLKKLYGKRLALIILQKDPRTYTIRQVDQLQPLNLSASYQKLNSMDPAAAGSDVGNRWGGSEEIGGSPRKTGTRLGPQEIADACRVALRRATPIQHTAAALSALLMSGACMLAGWGAAFYEAWTRTPFSAPLLNFPPVDFLLGSLFVGLVFLAYLLYKGQRHVYGVQFPAGWDWIMILPVGVLAGLLGGVWFVHFPQAGPAVMEISGIQKLLLMIGFALSAEWIFRGLAHGYLVRNYLIQGVRGGWFVSWPTLLTALIYAAWSISLHRNVTAPLDHLMGGWVNLVHLLAALLFGLAAGIARERSASVLSPILLNLLTQVLIWTAFLSFAAGK